MSVTRRAWVTLGLAGLIGCDDGARLGDDEAWDAQPVDVGVEPDAVESRDMTPDEAATDGGLPDGAAPDVALLPIEPPGGAATTAADGARAFRAAAPGLDGAARRSFTIGEALFDVDWVPEPGLPDDRDGLGPLYNATACQSCHGGRGRGAPPVSPAQTPNALLLRIGAGPDGAAPLGAYGDQLQTRAVPGVPAEVRISVSVEAMPGEYGDGAPFALVRPVYALSDWSAGEPADFVISPRVASPLIGLGLLAAVPEAELLAWADPDDLDGDGIAGRPNFVLDPETGERAIGRFGWKANQATLRAQNAAALAGDMGITSELAPAESCTAAQEACAQAALHDGVEITARALDALTDYTRFLGVPERRAADDPAVRAGEALFHRFGCAACHRPRLRTGPVPDAPPLSEQVIRPYSDLLLHDMGPDLADGRRDGLADGQMWRTPPLWGLGRTAEVGGHTRMLHDGRARDAAEAILWHGGEALHAREAFRLAGAEERARLLMFLGSL